MIRRKQLFRHQPHLDLLGDCHRTAIACLLDKEPWEVPHFYQKELTTPRYDPEKEIAKFLATHGLMGIDIHFNGEAGLEGVFGYMDMWNPDVYYILGGVSPRGTNHSVICRGGGFEWDPAKDGGFLVGPLDNNYFRLTFFTSLAMRAPA